MIAVDYSPPPNLIVIQCDDLGWDDLGLNNPEVHTPHLDELAAQSAQFESFTVNPVCAPSRATFLTGRHFLKTGVSHVHGGKDFLHLDERTLADHLLAAGYATGMWGKWHSGDAYGYHPWQRGFQQAYVTRLYRHRNTGGLLNGTPANHSRWADEVIIDYAMDFISSRRDVPFFAYLPTMTPHGPHDAPEHWIAYYEDRGHSPALARLWGMVSFLDEQIGRLLAWLDENDLAENTVLVFMSDNGPAIDRNTLSDEDRKKRRISGLRGWKGDLYENGVRSPLFIRWPKAIKPRVIRAPEDSVNLAPTLLAMAGVKPLPDAPAMDGHSFLPLLLGEREASTDILIMNYANRGWLTSGPPYSLDGIPGEYLPVDKATLAFEEQSLSIRRGAYKLLINPDYLPRGQSMLVNLDHDPGETRDISAKHPELSAELEETARRWWRELLEEKHAFYPPVFQLQPGGNTIPARAPSSLKGSLKNTVIELKGWTSNEDLAYYRMVNHNNQRASLSLHWREGVPYDTSWEFFIKETGQRASADSRAQAAIDLPKGVFHLGIRPMKSPPASLPGLRAIIITLPE